jgi:lysyl-tRNA synthetase class 2
MNLANLRAKAEIIKLIRRWFDERDFVEMHTPRMVGLPGQEPFLEPFWTTVVTPNAERETSASCDAAARTVEHVLNANPQREVACADAEQGSSFSAALITSPEYLMKRLLAEGMEKIYDLGPCFRNNEPWDGSHDPEFLLLEWYRRDAELEDLMRDTEEMMKWVCEKYVGAQFIAPNKKNASSDLGVINHAPTWIDQPFRRLTVEDAWREYAGIELAPLLGDREAMANVCREKNQTVTDGDSWDDLYYKIFLSFVEPGICGEFSRSDIPATFLYRYPASQAALARLSKDDARWADRVELYAGNLELANGFAELSDEKIQRERFEEERALRKNIGKPTWNLDERFLTSLPKMGNAAGIAFGVDRFVMVLLGASSINDVIPSSARERFTD